MTATTDTGVPTTDPLASVASPIVEALADILRTGLTPQALDAQALLLRRMALEGDVYPARIPAPRNITEVGGYLNLLETLKENDLRRSALAATLGVAGPAVVDGAFDDSGPTLFDVARTNDRPATAQQATFALSFHVRADFAAPFGQALTHIHAAGAYLPLVDIPSSLPPLVPTSATPVDLLSVLGRTLTMAPTAALISPDEDPLAVAQAAGATDWEVVARQIDTAPAQPVVAASWSAYQCTAAGAPVTGPAANRSYLPLAPILNAAGWYQAVPLAGAALPSTLAAPGRWGDWQNITGLVPYRTRLGDELQHRYTASEISQSALRDRLDDVWNGTDFVAA